MWRNAGPSVNHLLRTLPPCPFLLACTDMQCPELLCSASRILILHVGAQWQAPRKQLASKAARKSAPSTGGVKKPHRFRCSYAMCTFQRQKQWRNDSRSGCFMGLRA
jgi:hypothetical protein